MTTASNKETFNELCKRMGDRMNHAEAALICFQAHEAYEREFPDTAHGQGNKSDRDTSNDAFYKAAAKVSGMAPSTVSALLQVGKAIADLPKPVQRTLSASSLGKWMRGLRRLASKELASKRARIIKEFAEHERASDGDTAIERIRPKLGLMAGKTSKVPKTTTRSLARGGEMDITVGRYVVRVTVGWARPSLGACN
jgi:hypothetical protein